MEKTQLGAGPIRLTACLVASLSILLVLAAIGPAAARAGELTYVCGYDICTIDPNHTETHADLTETSELNELAPAWSPDGTRIAFTGDYPPDDYGDIYVIAPAAPTTVTDISNSPTEADSAAAWSADGTELAWEGENPAPPSGSPNLDIYVAPSLGTSTPQRVEPTSAEEREPAWSPSGAELAYGRLSSVYLASPLASLSASPLQGALGFFPAWSPDGSKIASVSTYTGAVRITDTDNSGTHVEMPIKGLFYSTVSWSPGSSHITYVDENDQVRVAPTNPPGEGFTIPLGSGIRVPHEPVWSPDGTQIAFAAEDIAAGYDEIYVAPASGGEPVLVTKTATTNIEPDWRPQPGAAGGGGSPGGGTGGSSGGSTSSPSGSQTTPPATHAPVVLTLAAFRHPYVNTGFVGGAYIPCNLGSTNAACHANGEATFDQPITHSLDRSRSTEKPLVFAKGSVTIPNGQTKPLMLKITGAGKKLLHPGKTLKLTVTIVETATGAKPKTTTKKLSVKVPKKS